MGETALNSIRGRKGVHQGNKFHDPGFLPDLQIHFDSLFEDCKEAVDQGCQVEVLQGQKLNGLNVQISFNKGADAWLIDMKVGTLVVKEKSDAEKYKGAQGRRQASIEAAKHWFELLEEHGKSKVAELKQDLSDSTLVGEFIGVLDLQGLIRYESEQLVFYGLVDNNSGIMHPPQELEKITTKYGLKRVLLESAGKFKNADLLLNEFRSLAAGVAGKKMSEVEEGNWVVFVKRNGENSYNDEVVSVWKVKNLEYKLLVKLKDKIRYFFSQKQNVSSDSLIQKYIKETKALVKYLHCSPPNSIDFYQDLCINSFTMLQRGEKSEQMKYKDLFYESFSKFVKEVISQDKKLSKMYPDLSFFSSRFCQQLKGHKQAKEELKREEEEEKHPAKEHPAKEHHPQYKAKEKKHEPEGQQKDSKKDHQQKEQHPKDHSQKEHSKEHPKDHKEGTKPSKPEKGQQQQQYKAKEKKSAHSPTIVLIAPPFAISKDAMEALHNEFHCVESSRFEESLLHLEAPKKGGFTLVYQAGLEGLLEGAASDKQSVFYLNFCFDQGSLSNSMVNTFITKQHVGMHCPRFLELNRQGKEEPLTLAKLKQYKSTQVALIEKTVEHLKGLDNYFSNFQSENDLMKAILDISKGHLPQSVPTPAPANNGDLSEEEAKIFDHVYSKKEQVGGSSRTLVLIPLAIPGIGKTVFSEGCLQEVAKQMGARVFSVSSDDIRKRLMDEYLKKHKGAQQSSAFKATGEQSGKIFTKELQHIMQDATKCPSSIVMVDKNHPPNAIKRTMEVLKKFQEGGAVRIIALVPKCVSTPEEYPFSYSMLVQCYLRCQFRDGHQTLSNEDPDLLARVMFGFFKAYHKIKFDSNFLSQNGFDSVIEFPFTFEDESVQLPQNLEAVIRKGLEITSNWTADPHPVFAQFYKLLFSYRKVFGGMPFKEDVNLREIRDLLVKEMKEEKKAVTVTQEQKVAPQKKTQEKSSQEKQAQEEKKAVEKQPAKEERKAEKKEEKRPPTHEKQAKKEAAVVKEEVPKVEAKAAKKETSREQWYEGEEEDKEEDDEVMMAMKPEEDKEHAELEKQESHVSETNQGEKSSQNKKKKKNKKKNKESQASEMQQHKEFKPYQPQAFGKQDTSGDFQMVQKCKQTQKKSGKLPLYLGLTLHSDPQFAKKMEGLLGKGLESFFNHFKGNELMKEFQTTMQKLSNPHNQWEAGWKKPDDFHVTSLFIGRREENTENDIYTNWADGEFVQVEVVALIVVPSKIVTAVCFPSYPCANKCPHVTLLTSDWAPKDSNTVLENTCLGEKKAFSKQYNRLKRLGLRTPSEQEEADEEEKETEKEEEVMEGAVRLDNSQPMSKCYFVTLKQPVAFTATTKTYR